MQSALTHLECSKCAAQYDADRVQHLCSCGGPLLARYDLAAAARTFQPHALAAREPSLWRYSELLPLRDFERRISLGETITPIVPLARFGKELGLPALSIKDEGALPTGSFKARGAAVGISRARELGVRAFAMPTNGNAGGAWTAYGARAGIEAHIVMPQSAPEINQRECTMLGAHVSLIDGLIGDAGRIVAQSIAEHGYYDAGTLREPYRIEGKKTMGFELVEQYAWKLPNVILYPMGGGVGLIGIYKALLELRDMGLLDGRFPRFVAVQAEGCAPIVRAWREGKSESQPWTNAHTVAFGINVSKALGDFLALRALYETDGAAIAVSDEAILEFQRRIAESEGLFICPEGAATAAAAAQLRRDGWIQDDERVLLINTASGLKSSAATGR